MLLWIIYLLYTAVGVISSGQHTVLRIDYAVGPSSAVHCAANQCAVGQRGRGFNTKVGVLFTVLDVSLLQWTVALMLCVFCILCLLLTQRQFKTQFKWPLDRVIFREKRQ